MTLLSESPLLPEPFRIIVYGASGSGKSKTQWRLIEQALHSMKFRHIYFFDGKGVELSSKRDVCDYYADNADYSKWVILLDQIINQIEYDYKVMAEGGIVTNNDPTKRDLIILEDATVALKYSDDKAKIQARIGRIFEVSRATGTCVIINTQKLKGAIPTTARENDTTKINMFGKGYYHLQTRGVGESSGRVQLDAELSDHPISSHTLVEILTPSKTDLGNKTSPAQIFYGERGNGLTYALLSYDPLVEYEQTIFIDFSVETRDLSVALAVDSIGGDSKATPSTHHYQILCLAMRQKDTILLLDNISKDVVRTVLDLVKYASETVMTIPSPDDWAIDLFRRSKYQQVLPMKNEEARLLAINLFPYQIEDYQRAVFRRYIDSIVKEASGSPKAITLMLSRSRPNIHEDIEQIRTIPKGANQSFAGIVVILIIAGGAFLVDDPTLQSMLFVIAALLGRRMITKWYSKIIR